MNERDLLEKIEFLENGIKYLAPSQTVELPIYMKMFGTALYRILKDNPITIHISYARSKGKFKLRLKDKFELEYWDSY